LAERLSERSIWQQSMASNVGATKLDFRVSGYATIDTCMVRDSNGLGVVTKVKRFMSRYIVIKSQPGYH
jgi:hypothetical protein